MLNEETNTGLKSPKGLTVLASTRIATHPELYKVIDLCNRTLHEQGIVFGLRKCGEEMTVTIYQA